MHVFVDEAGVAHDGEATSDHLVVAGVSVRAHNLDKLAPELAQLRTRLRRQNGQGLSWKDIRSHTQRLHAAQTVGQLPWIKTLTVVICKRELERNNMSPQERYQWTLRLLLERISWIAKKHDEVAHVVVSHIRGLEIDQLREYEEILRHIPTTIKWPWLDPAGCEVVQYTDYDELQLADIVASATACAFERDEFGNVEQRYLRELRTPIWNGLRVDQPGDGNIRSYGLKFHPGSALDLARYRWVRDF